MSFYSSEGNWAQDRLLPRGMRDPAWRAGVPSLEGGGQDQLALDHQVWPQKADGWKS